MIQIFMKGGPMMWPLLGITKVAIETQPESKP